MKTLVEVRDWSAGAAAELGDPAEAIGQVFARHVTIVQPSDEIVFAAGPDWVATPRADELAGAIQLILDVSAEPLLLPVATGGPIGDGEGLLAFGIRKVAPGLWYMEPSLNIPGVIHVFVILYDVPDPAPWERRVIVTA